MNAKKIRGEYVLIEPDIKDEVTASGIVVTKKKEPDDFFTGTIKMVGTGKKDKDVFYALDLSVGEKVLFRYGAKVEIGDGNSVLVNESDVIIILE
jgi:chaperonin GroES